MKMYSAQESPSSFSPSENVEMQTFEDIYIQIYLEKSFHKPQVYIVYCLYFIACNLTQTLAYPF